MGMRAVDRIIPWMFCMILVACGSGNTDGDDDDIVSGDGDADGDTDADGDADADADCGSPCGDCDAPCYGLCVGIGCVDPFEEDEGTSIILNPDGSITPSDGQEAVYQHPMSAPCPYEVFNIVTLEFDAVIPEGSEIAFRMRLADSLEALDQSEWIDIATAPDASSPVYIEPLFEPVFGDSYCSLPPYVMLEATLRSVDGVHLPTLRYLWLGYSCTLPIC
jgi:hypothetical protein